RSLYGTDPPVNAPPTIAPVTETIEPGAMRTVSLAVSDPDDAVADLVVVVDRDYDGSYDEVVVAQTLEVSFDEPGARAMKLRARGAGDEAPRARSRRRNRLRAGAHSRRGGSGGRSTQRRRERSRHHPLRPRLPLQRARRAAGPATLRLARPRALAAPTPRAP